MFKDDKTRLRHMIDAAKEAIEAVEGRSQADLARDRVWALGLVKCIEIVGEAASRLDPTTRDTNPQIPWAQIVGMRNRLIHAYFDIDPEQVWRTVTEDLPSLVAELEKIVGS